VKCRSGMAYFLAGLVGRGCLDGGDLWFTTLTATTANNKTLRVH
jgi:hypothetical protein